MTDFLIEYRRAEKMMRDRKKTAEALDAFVALAEREDATDFQAAAALSHAAECARRLDDFAKAEELAGRIPVDAVRKTVEMENLLGQRKWEAVLERFGEEDLGGWPFWQIGAGARARGRAAAAAKRGEQAEADFLLALEYTSDARTKMGLLIALARNRESTLGDEAAALEAYREVADSTTNAGGADYFYGLQGAARILAKQKKFDEALAVSRPGRPGEGRRIVARFFAPEPRRRFGRGGAGRGGEEDLPPRGRGRAGQRGAPEAGGGGDPVGLVSDAL